MVFASKHAYAVLMLGYLVVVYVAAKFIEGSRYGYRLFAVRDDEEAASAAGINPLLMRTSAMGISAFITGIGGSLFAQYFLYLDPTHVISPELSFQFALLPALGGSAARSARCSARSRSRRCPSCCGPISATPRTACISPSMAGSSSW